jgi:large subunit ribosomal protein L4
MIEAPQFSTAGKPSGTVSLPSEYFDGTVNEPVLHQAIKVYLANQRQGTHSTLTRRWVTGGNQKPWRQKGTGRARQGSTRSPLWPGGGVVFGPHPRDYRQDIPKKVRQLARRSALNARAREGSLFVVDALDFDGPKTAKLAGLLEAIGLEGKKVLILTHGLKRNVYLSGRNLPTVDVLPYPEAAAYDIIWADAVVVDQGAFGGEIEVEPAEAEAARERKSARKAAARKPGGKKAGAKPKAAKAAAKPAKKAAKPAAKPKKPAAKKKGAD